MKILLVTRGSQGDVLPYLAVARELVKRGHEVTVNIPHVFEEMAKKYPVKVVLQDFDNIGGMMADAADDAHAVSWDAFGGFIMVRAESLTQEAVSSAILATSSSTTA